MKFTKADAIESLKRELTNNGRKTLRMSEKSLDKLTDTLISEFADDEIGLPDFCTKALTYLNVFNDNIGKEKSDFINQWKAEHPETPPTPPASGQQTPTPLVSPEIEALKAEIESLKAENAKSKKATELNQRRKDIADKIKKKGVKDDEWIDSMLSKVNLDRELDTDTEADDFVKLYNKSRANGGGAPAPLNPNGGGQNKTYADAIKAAAKLAKNERAVIEHNNK